MHETRKAKTSVRGSAADLVSANDAGLGAVSTSNIIAGGQRTRKGASTNDDHSGQKGGVAPIDASLSPSKVTKNAQEKKGKRLKTTVYTGV
jgi:hypothetical protein